MGPIDFIVSNPAYFVGGVLLLGLVYLLFRSSKRSLDRAAAPRRNITYECVVTPALEADEKLRGQWPEQLEQTSHITGRIKPAVYIV